MPDSPTDDGAVTAAVERNRVSASGIVAAEPPDVFDFLRRPANHSVISGGTQRAGDGLGPRAAGRG